MAFFQNIKDRQQAKTEERNRNCEDLIARFSVAVEEANGYTSNNDEFTDVAVVDLWKRKYSALVSEYTDSKLKSLRKATRFLDLLELVCSAREFSASLKDIVHRHNIAVANTKIDKAYQLIGDVEGRKLDKQQMLSIIMESHNHLIIAGAGTGKTTTVVGKIKYLLKSGKCKPEDILVLSFTNASAAEMKERIEKETGCRIAASTFHKLGLTIIARVDGVKPKISKINLRTLIRDKIQDLIKNPAYMLALSTYLLFNRVKAKSEFEFESLSEYREYLLLNQPITIRGETVKSYGEMDIANFLFQKGIEYQYEAEYPVDTRTSEYGQYYPDFYLPDYDIYIEHFGINRQGEVPEWFSGRNGLSGTEAYRQSMDWKRKLHKKNRTVLIECYSYEKSEGILLTNLEKHLKDHGVQFNPRTPEELWSVAAKEDKGILDGIIELFETVINLMKSNGYSIDDFRAVASSSRNKIQYLSFIYLLEPLFTAYDSALKSDGEIDFNDMINKAADYIRSGRFTNPFSVVIVDEYQDISKSRFSLLAALRNSKDYELFCVGDDWQSIYRFAGSDINYILNFEKFWGPTTVSKIETTYRFTKSLIEISGDFVMRNPNQIRKNIVGKSPDQRFSLGEISAYNEKYAVEFMTTRLDDLPKNATVFFLGRYSFDIDIIKENGRFDCQYNNVSGFVDVRYRQRPDLQICFMTAHKSKGLQADYVFILNNKSSRMGFPSRIQDDPILELLLVNSETYPFAEERRLFYVVLTRAKTKAFILAVKDKESIFAQELEQRYGQQLKQDQFTCPLCGGKLVRRSGQYGDFFGCENYNVTGCRYIRKISSKTIEE
ncbi:MAG: UvrD-helicase domain-containing protein [Clostridia bacterium]|nr:UvrD-helicase domain-containing protein [Clostridia bacterium]